MVTTLRHPAFSQKPAKAFIDSFSAGSWAGPGWALAWARGAGLPRRANRARLELWGVLRGLGCVGEPPGEDGLGFRKHRGQLTEL